jgi:hydroxyacylglutathione hydrolase
VIEIFPIPALKDNYIWVITNPVSRHVTIVDPGDAQPVLKTLNDRGLILSTILVTHHHQDHTGGIAELLKHFSVPVISTKEVVDQQKILLSEQQLSLNIMTIPGHTLDHIAFYNDKILFCGDTLFTGGCGRVFEGTHQQMLTSLQKLKSLAPDIQVYCAHEYTLKNLSFASFVEPDNLKIQQRLEQAKLKRANNLSTIPSTMQEELDTNPFLRIDNPAIKTAVENHAQISLNTPLEIFTALRSWKDSF